MGLPPGSSRKLAHRACALLSVILGTCWIPRSGPDVQAPGGPERGLSAVPQSIGSWERTPYTDESLPADFNVYDGDDPLVLPAWTQHAWDLMEQDETVRRAVHSCYEALGLEMEHPLAAFVVYVATIEGIGARLVKERGSNVGARRRFKEALRTVLPDAEVKALADEAYNVRCQTGHEGQPLAPSRSLATRVFPSSSSTTPICSTSACLAHAQGVPRVRTVDGRSGAGRA
jgi:hypothetical protein